MQSGGIGIVRMSGDNVFEILEKVFRPKAKSTEIKGYTIKYGHIIDRERNEIIDEVLVSYFVSPRSYTTENMCEINSHGGITVVRKILDICLKNGAELAEPGEFTKKAFLNGRIDLSQAEAVIDIINAKNELEAKKAVKQLDGNLGKVISKINEKMMDIIININVNIDYPEYDEGNVERNLIINKLKIIYNDLEKLERSFSVGKIIKNGINTVILGKPNAGKSSLLNKILKEDRAIVSNIKGTTRDTIEEFVNVEGLLLKLIDTAGIRKTEDEIERIGVEKSRKTAEFADLIIAIFDMSTEFEKEDQDILDIIKEKNAIILLNKTDIAPKNIELEEKIEKLDKKVIKISVENDEGIEDIYSSIKELYDLGQIEDSNDEVISNERHFELIKKAKKDIEESIKISESQEYLEMIEVYIRKAMEFLGNITGTNVSENIIEEIFKQFCLGK